MGTERVDVLRHLPSWRVLAIGFGTIAAAALAYLAARETPMFALRSVEVSGAPPALAARVENTLEQFDGTSLLALHLGDLDRELGTIPEIAGANYDRDFPHTLRVMVWVDPAVAVLRKGVDAWLVSARARILMPLDRPELSSLPRVWLAARDDVSRGETLTDPDTLHAVRTLAVLRRTRFPVRVRLVKSSEHELTLVLDNGRELRLGDQVALWLKLAVARRILFAVGGESTTHYVDVSVPERPVVG